MLNLKSTMLQIICFVVCLLLLGCEDVKRKTPSAVNVYRIVKEDTGNYGYLNATIDRAGMKSFFESSKSDFTLYAPVNQDFIGSGYNNILSLKNEAPGVLDFF